MKANADKCHLLLTNNEENNIFIGGETIKNNEKENLLGIIVDNKLFY